MGFYWYFIPVVLLISAFGLGKQVASYDNRSVVATTRQCLVVCSASYSPVESHPFLSAECNISLFPQEPVPPCSTSIVLKCSFCDLHYVRFEELADDALRFVVLTSNNILRNSDYEEVVSDGLYKLKIAQVMKYNGTQYRCHGFDGTFLKVSSAPFKLLIPSEYAALVACYLTASIVATCMMAMLFYLLLTKGCQCFSLQLKAIVLQK